MAEDDAGDGLRVGENSFELEGPEEERLIGGGPLLHDAGNAGEVEGQEGERQRAGKETPLADREGKGAVEGDDESPLRPLVLELLEVEEEERLYPRVLVEAAVAGMPVLFPVTDLHGDWPDEGRK